MAPAASKNAPISPCFISILQARVRGVLLLDPSAEEASLEDAGVLLAATGVGAEVTQMISRGRWSDAELKEAVELCLGGCAQLDGAARQALRGAAAAKLLEREGAGS